MLALHKQKAKKLDTQARARPENVGTAVALLLGHHNFPMVGMETVGKARDSPGDLIIQKKVSCPRDPWASPPTSIPLA